jgi:ABC-2 type transport system permease protein
MSAATAEQHAPPALAPRQFRRPPVRSVYRWELRKLISQKRTYLGFGLGAILPLAFVIVQLLRHHQQRGGDSIFFSEITQSGLVTPVLMLIFLSAFMIPVIAALVAGDIVANEDGNGTLKTILTRSVDRGQVFTAKTLAAMTYAAIALYISAAVGTIAGLAAWGFHPIVTLSGSKVSASEALLLIFAGNACYLIPLFAVVCIGVLLSTVTRNSAAAVVATIGIVILLYILAQIPGLEGLRPYMLTEQFQAWQGLLRTPTNWAPITHSAWVCALYALPALLAAYLVFLRRDVAGG